MRTRLLLLASAATLAGALGIGLTGSRGPRLLANRARAQLLATATAEPEGAQELAMEADSLREVYFIMGGPGSGKGTQCERLVKRFHATHLSAGDLLRAEVASGSETGRAIAGVIAEGKIVASETTVGLLQAAMARSRGPFLVDGFPRSLDNLKAFEKELPQGVFMLFLDVSEDVMLRGESSGRSDDNEATIRNRFQTFLDESMPVVQELERRSRLRRVSAGGSADEVFQRVCGVFADQELTVFADQDC
jgi:adenylate kinase family enzyme